MHFFRVLWCTLTDFQSAFACRHGILLRKKEDLTFIAYKIFTYKNMIHLPKWSNLRLDIKCMSLLILKILGNLNFHFRKHVKCEKYKVNLKSFASNNRIQPPHFILARFSFLIL